MTTILYHGSENIIKKPIFGFGKTYNDYGLGFYCTAKPETNLKLLRHQAGLTQKQLADLSGIPLRTIQQYEQRRKNINKAQAEYLIMLARSLSCEAEDLLERME